MHSIRPVILMFLSCLATASLDAPAQAEDVRLKDLGRFLGWRDNSLVGYGVVVGLSGSGDTARSAMTRQALRNVLGRMGTDIAADQIQSRNAAVVMVTATLPPSANVGDKIDVTVSSIGDARSLVGGTLLMVPLLGADQKAYALAQGAIVVGGFRFDANLNVRQQNYPTAGILPSGGTVEAAVEANLVAPGGELIFILKEADTTTAARVAEAINSRIGVSAASVRTADSVRIDIRAAGRDAQRVIAAVETLTVRPDQQARVVINERSGTVVAGAGVQISSVVIAQGDIRVAVTIDNRASQPLGYGGYGGNEYDSGGVRSLIVTNTRLDVSERPADAAIRLPNTTIADLVQGLRQAHVNTRGMIAILQALKAAGALYAEIIVQ